MGRRTGNEGGYAGHFVETHALPLWWALLDRELLGVEVGSIRSMLMEVMSANSWVGAYVCALLDIIRGRSSKAFQSIYPFVHPFICGEAVRVINDERSSWDILHTG